MLLFYNIINMVHHLEVKNVVHGIKIYRNLLIGILINKIKNQINKK